MKRLLTILVFLGVGLYALDNEGWLAKARENALQGVMMDSDETTEDGVYCLVLSLVSHSSGESRNDASIDEAILDAKKRITAYVKGEKVSALVAVDTQTVTRSSNDEKIVEKYKKFEKRIQSKVNALVVGIKCLGQVTANDKHYIVCVTCERFEDQAEALRKAQAQFGDEGVVTAVGEASSSEIATQKAIRGAVEQVLGTVVVGYDRFNSRQDFQTKVFSGTNGVVETYRVLSESDVNNGKRIEIVAKISKSKLADDYTNYLKFLGNPAFYIKGNTPELESYFSDFINNLGIKITPSYEEASYVISCCGRFRPVQHPINKEQKGVQLSLRFTVMEVNGNETLIDLMNDPRKSTSFVGDSMERQMEICAGKAFRQMKQPLHERIQSMIAKLVGREMDKIMMDKDD